MRNKIAWLCHSLMTTLTEYFLNTNIYGILKNIFCKNYKMRENDCPVTDLITNITYPISSELYD